MKRTPIPTEANEQAALFRWADVASGAHPELKLLHHIPNGGSRDPREAHNLRLQGVKPGVPDIFLPVPKGRHHGLYIELKRVRGGRVSDDQRAWLDRLNHLGYRALVCKGWQEAQTAILDYLNGGAQ